jgi:hypothetical protein
MKHPFSILAALLFLSLASLGCKGTEQQIADVTPAYDSTALHTGLNALNLERYRSISYNGHHPSARDGSWEIYTYDTADCRCILGDTVTISMRRAPGSKDVTFLMLGGGACWPGTLDCTHYSTDGNTLVSNLTSLDPQNPLAGWNMIYVPYCDGSVHMGDNAADYDSNNSPDHWHWGLRQTTAALNLMKEKIDTVKRVFITGCSAGGYGTIVATLLIRQAYPAAEIFVFNESGPGLFNPADPHTFETIKATWKIQSLLPADCSKCSAQIIYIYDWLLERDSRLRIGLYSSYEDRIIGSNYLSMAPAEFRVLLMNVSGEIHGRHAARFKRFFVSGSSHCISDYLKTVDTVSIISWIGQMINNSSAWTEHFE